MSYRYEETNLIQALSAIPPAHRTVFAAACAERLLPAYAPIGRRKDSTFADKPRSMLDQVWSSVGTREAVTGEESLLSLLPPDMEDWAEIAPYAEDAIAALVYATKTTRSGDSQEAAWAARRVYEALDQFVLHHSGVEFSRPDAEEELLAHPVIQSELQRQDEDLRDLVLSGVTANHDAIRQIRARAATNAYHILDTGHG